MLTQQERDNIIREQQHTTDWREMIIKQLTNLQEGREADRKILELLYDDLKLRRFVKNFLKFLIGVGVLTAIGLHLPHWLTHLLGINPKSLSPPK